MSNDLNWKQPQQWPCEHPVHENTDNTLSWYLSFVVWVSVGVNNGDGLAGFDQISFVCWWRQFQSSNLTASFLRACCYSRRAATLLLHQTEGGHQEKECKFFKGRTQKILNSYSLSLIQNPEHLPKFPFNKVKSWAGLRWGSMFIGHFSWILVTNCFKNYVQNIRDRAHSNARFKKRKDVDKRALKPVWMRNVYMSGECCWVDLWHLVTQQEQLQDVWGL